MNDIRAITLDLDDTLWPIEPVIHAAERAVFAWLGKHCPEIAEKHCITDLREHRIGFAARHPSLGHDFTALRFGSLRELLAAHGYSEELAESALQVFLHERNRVTLFPDVLPALRVLSKHYSLASVSNGNADLKAIGLDGYFTATVSAAKVGVTKPHKDMFLTACEALGQKPEHTLHVGDHPTQDVLGAAQAGMSTIWVNRDRGDWLYDHDADAEADTLFEVARLLNLDQQHTHPTGEPR